LHAASAVTSTLIGALIGRAAAPSKTVPIKLAAIGPFLHLFL
jgi:hypothetical protein